MRARPTRGRRLGERGSATVVMAGALAIAVLVAMGAARLGVAAVAAARADAAADAAALAAADMLALDRGSEAARDAARRTAAANGAQLVHCSCWPPRPTVEVTVPAGALGALAHARARAEVREECRLGCEANGSGAR